MAELERFEARLAASLDRLADEVPTEVDAALLARTVASAGVDRGWLAVLTGARDRRLTQALLAVLVLAALVALPLAMIGLAPRLTRTPLESTIRGAMTCGGGAWTASPSGTVELDCTTDLEDPRLAGRVTIILDEPSSMGGMAVRHGSVEIDAAGATWSGAIQVLVAANGVAVADASLTGAGTAADSTVSARLLSDDGIEWGLLIWPEATP